MRAHEDDGLTFLEAALNPCHPHKQGPFGGMAVHGAVRPSQLGFAFPEIPERRPSSFQPPGFLENVTECKALWIEEFLPRNLDCLPSSFLVKLGSELKSLISSLGALGIHRLPESGSCV